jgi:hypothetical protein
MSGRPALPHVCFNCARELPDRSAGQRRLCEPCARLYYRLHRWRGRAIRAERLVRQFRKLLKGVTQWPLVAGKRS